MWEEVELRAEIGVGRFHPDLLALASCCGFPSHVVGELVVVVVVQASLWWRPALREILGQREAP
jgi:hypothetical protein